MRHIAILFGLLLTAITAHAKRPIPIYGTPFPIYISVPGDYIVMSGTGAGGAIFGVVILADNVTVNLNGHESIGFGYGVEIWGDHDTVYNGTAQGPYNGVIIIGSYALVQDVVMDAIDSPLYIEFGNYNRVRNCTLEASNGQKAVVLYLTSAAYH